MKKNEVLSSEAGRRAVLPASFIVSALTYSAWTTARQVRGALNHPSKAARFALVGSLVVDVAMSSYVVGKMKGSQRYETPEQKEKRLDEPNQITPLRLALGARDGLALGLVGSQSRSVGRSLAMGAVGYAVNVGFQYAARAVHPRVRRMARDLEAYTERQKLKQSIRRSAERLRAERAG